MRCCCCVVFFRILILVAAVLQLDPVLALLAAPSSSSSRQHHADPVVVGQVILTTRKIRNCGSNVTKCFELLHQLSESQHLSSSPATTSFTAEERRVYAPSRALTPKDESESHRSGTILEPAYLEALTVINQAQKQRKENPDHLLQRALDLFEICPTEPMRSRTISMCGQHGSPGAAGVETALKLLYHQGDQLRNVASVNAALAVCAQAKQWRQALHVLHRHQDAVVASNVSTLTCNIVLTAMERAQQGNAAVDLLQRMLLVNDDTNFNRKYRLGSPDRSSFHRVMNALIMSAPHRNAGTKVQQHDKSQVDAAYNLVGTMVTHSVPPNNSTWDLLVSAYGRANDWDMVAAVDNLRASASFNKGATAFRNAMQLRESWRRRIDTSNRQNAANLNLHWESNRHGMKKVGNGKFAYWELASYSGSVSSNISLIVALQPHRNPSKNGIKILLIDGEKRKLGFLLMINSAKDNTSTLLGVYLNPSIRKYGLSKVILALWMDLCRRADISTRTGVINKPLLALVLQETFGFVPESRRKQGVLVEISPGTDGSNTVELYAPSLKSLQGVFGAWDLQRDCIRLTSCAPDPRGRSCRVGTTLMPAAEPGSVVEAVAHELVDRANGRRLCYRSEDIPWRRIFLGSQA